MRTPPSFASLVDPRHLQIGARPRPAGRSSELGKTGLVLGLKKIPKTVLHSREWSHDDYSLNVANLPMAQHDVPAPATAVRGRGTRTVAPPQPGLFEDDSASDSGEGA